jgi:hypothetical protein
MKSPTNFSLSRGYWLSDCGSRRQTHVCRTSQLTRYSASGSMRLTKKIDDDWRANRKLAPASGPLMTTLPSTELDCQLRRRRRAREEDSFSRPILSLSTLRRKSVLAGWRLKSRDRRGIRSPRSGYSLAGWREANQNPAVICLSGRNRRVSDQMPDPPFQPHFPHCLIL